MTISYEELRGEIGVLKTENYDLKVENNNVKAQNKGLMSEITQPEAENQHLKVSVHRMR